MARWRDFVLLWLQRLKRIYIYIYIERSKAVPVTGRGDLYGFKTSRLPHFLDNRLTDSGEVISLTRRSPFIQGKIPGTHFC
jgi:hypothetical protein